jgi:ParB/Sulfiredoxin domain
LLEITYRPLKGLIPYAKNARKHPRSQIQKLKASLAEFGWANPMLIADNVMVAGHGRLTAALEMAEAGIPIPRNPDFWQGPTVDLSHLTKTQRAAYVLQDNRSAMDGEWDEELLAVELTGLQEAGFDLTLTGFDMGEIAEYVPSLEGGGEGLEPETADLLQRLDITIAEPRHQVEPGDRYMLSERHYLFCVGVIDSGKDWAQLLLDIEGSYFCPYPGPCVPFGKKADEHQLIMVQPDVYIAGHLLDRYADAYGEESVVKI